MIVGGNTAVIFLGGDTQGWPNGRRLNDDVIDIALQVVEGELVGAPNDLGDGVNANDSKFGTHFPYVALPHSGSRGGSPTTASAGLTALDGGGTNGSGGSSTPIGSALALGVGLLTMIGGTVALRRSRRSSVAVTPAA